MNLSRSPIAREIFSQWQRARGKQTAPSNLPFSRNWEALLESAKLLGASERTDAENDARECLADGILEIKTDRLRPRRITRISIPLSAEPTWFQAFGFSLPSDEEARKIQAHPWEPRLAFVAKTRTSIPFSDLLSIDAFLKREPPLAPIVPIKERSLQMFNDEKRLDELAGSSLFRPGCIRLSDDLRCEKIGVPFGWKRGPAHASAKAIIILENAASWHSYCRWNATHGGFSAVVYGDGNCFLDSVRYLPDLFEELGGQREIFYFGDIDFQGLAIPQYASRAAQEIGLPAIQPHLWSYRKLLKIDSRHFQKMDTEPTESVPVWEWLEDCAAPAREILLSGHRLPQEHLGWEFLGQFCSMLSSG